MTDPGARPRVLLIAYACGPSAGSEPGAGWAMVRLAAEAMHLTIVTRPDQVEPLRKWQDVDQGRRQKFDVVGLPLRFVSRPGNFPAYLAWLAIVRRQLPQLIERFDADGVWHATYSTAWLPSVNPPSGTPLVWGPVGGYVTAPPWFEHRRSRDRLVQILNDGAVRLAATIDGARRSARRADLILSQNPQTTAALRRVEGHGPIVEFNHAVGVDAGAAIASVDPSRDLIWISPLQPRKAPSLVLEALAKTQAPVSLTLIGDGPLKADLERQAQHLGIAERVTFAGRLPRDVALARVAASPGAVFTGVNEEGGLALAESLVLGTPTIALDHGGPSTILDQVADPSFVRRIAAHGSRGDVTDRLATAMSELHTRATRSSAPLLDQEALSADLVSHVTQLIQAECRTAQNWRQNQSESP